MEGEVVALTPFSAIGRRTFQTIHSVHIASQFSARNHSSTPSVSHLIVGPRQVRSPSTAFT